MERYIAFEAFASLAALAGRAGEPPGKDITLTASPTGADLEEIFLYRVPESLDDGSCSASKTLAKEPFDLGAELFGSADWRATAAAHPVTQTILRLRAVVRRLQASTEVDWVGVYKLIEKDGKRYLLKLAYVGRESRAIFPLNSLFHDISNNSWVAMEATPKLIQDVSAYEGPYYACDGAVQSELCVPIFDEDGRVLGIIDAESFQPHFFTPARILEVFRTCLELGKRNLGFE